MTSQRDIVSLSAARTALGSFQGALADVPAAQLGAAAIKGALAKAAFAADDVTDVLMGNVLQAGQGQAPARQAAIHAGLPHSTRATTIDAFVPPKPKQLASAARTFRRTAVFGVKFSPKSAQAGSMFSKLIDGGMIP